MQGIGPITASALVARGTLRNSFVGASTGAGWWSAMRKAARVSAVAASSSGGDTAAVVPGSHGHTLQCHGYPCSGTPLTSGVGTGRGSRGAISGSQRCSWSTSRSPTVRLGNRATCRSPTRTIWLSHPAAPNCSGSSARSGHCEPSSRRTSASSMWCSAGGIATVSIRAARPGRVVAASPCRPSRTVRGSSLPEVGGAPDGRPPSARSRPCR